jgi:hypothetical protein
LYFEYLDARCWTPRALNPSTKPATLLVTKRHSPLLAITPSRAKQLLRPEQEVPVKIVLLTAFALAIAPTTFAKGSGKGKYHCMKADGTEDATAKNKKDCAKAGGKWQKMKMDTGKAPSK